MKNERKITVPLMKYLGGHLRGAHLIKHNDRSTGGIPDLTVTWKGYTFWIENKYQRKGESLRKITDDQQLIMCHDLAMASMGRCWVSVYSYDPMTLTIWQPRVLMSRLYPKVILGEIDMEPADIDDPKVNVFHALQTTGAIRTRGWEHELQRRLIIDAFTASLLA